MPQLEHIEAIENRLWRAADDLRANSSFASNEYFLPVMGLVFLRHAYSRFLAARERIEAGLPTRGPVLDARDNAGRYLELMRLDKKAESGAIRFIVIERPGRAVLRTAPDALVRSVVDHCCETEAVLQPA